MRVTVSDGTVKENSFVCVKDNDLVSVTMLVLLSVRVTVPEYDDVGEPESV